ncbi:MAG: hypothetical protein QXL15_01745 [Candidatus Korarchaeota archaeon]
MILTDIFGDSAIVRFLDALLDNPNISLTLSEWAKRAGVANSSLSRIYPILVKEKIVTIVGKINNMTVIALNKDSAIVKLLLSFYSELKKLRKYE